MSKLLWKSLFLSTAFLASAIIAPVSAQTSNTELLDQIDQYNQEGAQPTQGQVRSITQLRDVSPGDWAYDALRNLVENYDCIEGYPNRTYRGNRALTRYEFAAGLSACLDSILGLGDGLDPAELDQIRRLVNEFEAELATLGTRVDNLEGRVAFLEDNQFSTTTKLKGEAIFALTDIWGGDQTNQITGLPSGFELGEANNTVLGDRVRLVLESSFTGDDTLITRLAAGNLDNFGGVAFPDTYQTFNIGNTGNNNVDIDWLSYYFPAGRAEIYVAAFGGIHSDYAPTLNPYFEDFDGGNGALSSFASENPIYRIGGGSGAAVTIPFGDIGTFIGDSSVSFGYLADGSAFTGAGAGDPSNKGGLFNGDYAALGQVNFNLGDKVGVGFTYVHGYHNSGTSIFDLGGDTGVVGTFLANNPGFGVSPTVSNSYGAEVAWTPSEKISVSGFFNYTDAIIIGTGDAEIWSYGGGVAFPDLGKEGSVLGIFGGAQPYAGNYVAGVPGFVAGDGAPWHVEAFYKYKVNDNISITPGLIWLTDPAADSNAIDVDDAFIGTIRTTFTF